MAMPISQELLISTLALLVALYLYLRNIRSKNPTMLLTPIYRFSSIMANLHNLHDHLTLVLTREAGHSVRAHGPPGTGMRFFFTCDPANVRHLFTTNFSNFPKGEDFAAIFDILDGILTVDGETWRRQRALLVDMLSSPRFVAGMGARVRNKVEKSLLPLCAGIARAGTPFDLQELTTRLMFDLTSAMVFGVDPGLLSSDRPPMTASGAMDAVMDVAFLRHTMPAFCWKAMRWLNIGPERRLQAAHIVLRGFVAEMIERRTVTRGPVANDVEEKGTEDVVSFFMNKPAYIGNHDLLRATLLGSMIAGRDTIGTTLPWIFYNLAQNPDTVSAIRNELSPIASRKTAGTTMVIFEPHETKSLTYLKAALYETLRLYPPAPVARKTVILNDILPTGHEVYAGDTICVCLHSMGRMEGIWGKDCLNYNPDRWLSEDGTKLRHVQSHKFLAFSSGPGICPGIELAFMQMKTVVAAVVWNFDMEVVAGQTIEPKTSSLLQMKNGLILKLKKREI